LPRGERAQLLNSERADGRIAERVLLRGRSDKGGAVLAEVATAIEVAWSPYTTLPNRPSLRSTKRDLRMAGMTGDLTRDALTYLTRLEEQAPPDERGTGVPKAAAERALLALGCRASPDDIAAITAPLPERLAAKELAVALGEHKEQLYASAHRTVVGHMALQGAE
jgi:hypothetical protein